METVAGKILEWGIANRVLAGERVSGDRHVVCFFPGGALAAVIDGVGHGEEAAEAAEIAAKVLQERASEPVPLLVEACHEALKGTRGAVMSVVSFQADEAQLAGIGVGNVETVFLRATPDGEKIGEFLVLRSGLVGSRLPSLRSMTIGIAPQDLVIFATDGIRPDFSEDLNISQPAQQIADAILRTKSKGTDDALVLVVRYCGGA